MDAASLLMMEGRIAHEGTLVFNNVWNCSNFQLKWRSPSNSDAVAFDWIDRAVLIYRLIPDIVEGALQKVAL